MGFETLEDSRASHHAAPEPVLVLSLDINQPAGWASHS